MMVNATSADRLGRLARAPLPVRRHGRQYSRLVRYLRLLLPLFAGALLLLAVIWPKLDFKNAIDSSSLQVSLNDVASQEVSMRSARLIGTDEEGRPFIVSAEEARQSDGMLSRVTLKHPSGQLQLADGTIVRMRAESGEYDRESEQAVFRGNVTVTHGQNYEIHTEIAYVDLHAGRAYGDAPVRGAGPEGKLQGSGFEILDRGATVRVLGKSHLLVTDVPKQI
jgi:lipopolysaccharide export system protein LptC